MSICASEVSLDDMETMRKWVCAHVWPDLEPDEVEEMEPQRVIEGVERFYEGGMEGFLTPSELPAEEELC